MSGLFWHGEIESDHCGYCLPGKTPHCVKHGFTSNFIFADDYDCLMNVGWRRCGTFFYKPVMHKVGFPT